MIAAVNIRLVYKISVIAAVNIMLVYNLKNALLMFLR